MKAADIEVGKAYKTHPGYHGVRPTGFKAEVLGPAAPDTRRHGKSGHKAWRMKALANYDGGWRATIKKGDEFVVQSNEIHSPWTEDDERAWQLKTRNVRANREILARLTDALGLVEETPHRMTDGIDAEPNDERWAKMNAQHQVNPTFTLSVGAVRHILDHMESYTS